jgi:cobalamin biosynthesis protein CobT
MRHDSMITQELDPALEIVDAATARAMLAGEPLPEAVEDTSSEDSEEASEEPEVASEDSEEASEEPEVASEDSEEASEESEEASNEGEDAAENAEEPPAAE